MFLPLSTLQEISNPVEVIFSPLPEQIKQLLVVVQCSEHQLAFSFHPTYFLYL